MKINGEFVIREFNETIYAVPVGQTAGVVKGAIKLNSTARTLWDALTAGCGKEEMVQSVLASYDIDRDTAEHDVDKFIASLKTAKLLEA